MPDVTTSSLLVYLAVACSVGGFLLYNYGLRRMAPSVAVNILNLVPVFGVLSAVIINGEPFRLAQAAGGAVIVAGVALGLIDRQAPGSSTSPTRTTAAPSPRAEPRSAQV